MMSKQCTVQPLVMNILTIIASAFKTGVLSYSYKQPIFGLTQEWFRELSFSRLECGVHDRLHIYPLCGIFYFPAIDTRTCRADSGQPTTVSERV